MSILFFILKYAKSELLPNKIKHSDSYKQCRQPQSVNLKTWAVFIYLAMINIKKCAIISPDQKTRRFLFLWSLFF